MSTTKSDEVRAYVFNNYIVPARAQKSATVTIVTGDMTRALNVKARAVCPALMAALAKVMPRSSRNPRIWLIAAVRRCTNRSRIRCKAYGAGRGNKLLVVVDGMEGKDYDGIMAGTPVFSPDSKHRPSALRRKAPHSVPISSSRTLSPSPVSA